MKGNGSGRITRADIEAKIGELQGDVEATGEEAKGLGMILVGVAVVVVIGVAFLIGKRRGKRQTTTIEIWRV